MSLVNVVTILNLARLNLDYSNYYIRLSEQEKKFVDEKLKEVKNGK